MEVLPFKTTDIENNIKNQRFFKSQIRRSSKFNLANCCFPREMRNGLTNEINKCKQFSLMYITTVPVKYAEASFAKNSSNENYFPLKWLSDKKETRKPTFQKQIHIFYLNKNILRKITLERNSFFSERENAKNNFLKMYMYLKTLILAPLSKLLMTTTNSMLVK